jgi:predicted SAM-dependent methyltransferase
MLSTGASRLFGCGCCGAWVVLESTLSREELIRRYFTRDDNLLEIGPSHSAIVPPSDGWHTRIIDHASQQELVEKYTRMGVKNVDRIDRVDFIWKGEALPRLIPREMHSTFDGLIASHVGEHLPDFIGFLQDASVLLKSEGVIALALPDKRVCFDFFQPLTTTGDLLAAHSERRVRHQRRTFFNQAAYFVTRNGEGGWAHGENAAAFNLNNSLWEDQRAYDFADEDPASDYSDSHAWTFTPKSFELIMLELNLLGHIDWAIRAIEPAAGVEFYVWLERLRVTMPKVEVNRADSSGRRNRICWLTGRHGKPTLHLLTVEHAIWRRSFRRCW